MTAKRELALEWFGNSLYRASYKGDRRFYVGTVIQNAFGGDWTVWVRGKYLSRHEDRKTARMALEAEARRKYEDEK